MKVGNAAPGAPEYPGYAASSCNGCGACCLTVPCAISLQFRLWKDGRCRALRFAAGRYWCDAIANPRRVSVALARASKADRIDAIGSGNGCDHRAARTEAEALAVLAERNLWDRITDNPEDSYPRMCIVHRDDGTQWVVTIYATDRPPTIQQCVAGLPHGREEILEL